MSPNDAHNGTILDDIGMTSLETARSLTRLAREISLELRASSAAGDIADSAKAIQELYRASKMAIEFAYIVVEDDSDVEDVT